MYRNQLACTCDKDLIYNPTKMITLNSQIIDFGTGLPLDNVNVYVQDTPTVGVISGVDGSFSLAAAPDDIIVFSHVGYGTLEIAAKDIFPVEYMNEEVNALDEIIVVAKKKKKWLLGGLAALGLFWIVSNSDDDEKPAPKNKKTVKAKV